MVKLVGGGSVFNGAYLVQFQILFRYFWVFLVPFEKLFIVLIEICPFHTGLYHWTFKFYSKSLSLIALFSVNCGPVLTSIQVSFSPIHRGRLGSGGLCPTIPSGHNILDSFQVRVQAPKTDRSVKLPKLSGIFNKKSPIPAQIGLQWQVLMILSMILAQRQFDMVQEKAVV